MNPLLRTYDHLSRRRWLALVLWLSVVALSLLLSSRLRMKEDIVDFLTSDSLSTRYMSVYRQIGGQDRMVIVASSDLDDEVLRADAIKAALADFEAALHAVDTCGVLGAFSMQVDEALFSDMLDFVVSHAPLLLTADDVRRADSLLSSPTYVREALEQSYQQLLLPTGGMSSYTVRADPLHLFTPLLTRLHSLNSGSGYTLDEGYIFTPDMQAGLGFIVSPYGSSDSGRNRELRDMLDDAVRSIAAAHPSVTFSAIGAPLIAVSNADCIKTDGLVAGLLSVILIVLVLWLVFRRVGDIMWMLLSIATGYAIALGVMSLYRHELSVIVLGTSSVLVGIAANYPLHYLDHRRHERHERQALSDMIAPLLTGNITTVSAFACLAWMDSEAMRDLGILGALVLVGTILFVLTLLPVLVARRPSAAEERSVPDTPLAATSAGVSYPAQATADAPSPSLLRSCTHRLSAAVHSRYFFFLLLSLTGVLCYFSLQTTFDTNLQHINYMTAEQREHLSLLNVGLETASGTEVLAVAEGTSVNQTLERAEQMCDSLRAAGLAIRSLSPFMPSERSQSAAIARWQAFVERHRASLTRDLQSAGQSLGFSSDAFSPFLSLVDEPLTPLPASAFSPVIAAVGAPFLLLEGEGSATDDLNADQSEGVTSPRVVTYIQGEHPMSDGDKEMWRKRFAPLGFVFDSRDVQTSLSTTLTDDFNYIGFVCGFVVFFFLWLSMGSLELSLMSFLPLAVGWVWILGIMQLCDIQFNIVNIILATFIFGQGDDYTIFITDGLVHEHTYGRPVLKGYRNSVALSALLMFIGIGSLVFARHPALRSLGEVVIIGMVTVVFMAFYLPPLVFQWITTKGGRLREVPLTLERLAITACVWLFYLVIGSAYQLFAFVWSHLGRYTERKKHFFHRTLYRISRFCIEHVPGTTYTVSNPYGERLDRPAIIVCNHQSQLDLMAVLSISPKVVILTKQWVWNNPLYGLILRAAEFYPVSEGVSNIQDRVGDLLRRGYSVITFPEGTRSKDRQIHRFHQGAFHMAKVHQVDILPVFLNGLGHVLPKDELVFRRGTMHMEIGRRITPSEFADSDTRTLTRNLHRYFVHHYAQLCREQETTAAVVPYVRYQYMYKEVGVKREAMRRLKEIASHAAEIDQWHGGATHVITSCGQGEQAFVFALVHPDVEVVGTDPDADKIAVARNVNIHLKNLRFEVS